MDLTTSSLWWVFSLCFEGKESFFKLSLLLELIMSSISVQGFAWPACFLRHSDFFSLNLLNFPFFVSSSLFLSFFPSHHYCLSHLMPCEVLLRTEILHHISATAKNPAPASCCTHTCSCCNKNACWNHSCFTVFACIRLHTEEKLCTQPPVACGLGSKLMVSSSLCNLFLSSDVGRETR